MRSWRACVLKAARSAAGRRALLALLAFGSATRAAAEVHATVAIASDDRFRGRSVSQGRPVASVDLAYDAADGAYVGFAASGVVSRHDGAQFLSAQEYAGYVTRLPAGPRLDVGVTHLNYTEYYSGDETTQYTELYAGLITDRFTTRLYYSPDYFGRRNSTLYGEIETAVRPARNLRLTAHAGMLAYLTGSRPEGRKSSEYDWRVGLTTLVRGFEVELAWSGAGPDRDYYAGAPRSRSGVAVALRRSF